MKISSYSIAKLFGTFSYTFSFEEKGNVIVITGPNGYGKTTSLLILEELSRKNLYFFYKLRFDEISLCFDNGSKMEITSSLTWEHSETTKGEDILLTPYRSVLFTWYSTKGEACASITINDVLIQSAKSFYQRLRRNRESLEDFDTYIAAHPSMLELVLEPDIHHNYMDILLYLEQLSVVYIPADRLREQNVQITNKYTVENVAQSLSAKMQESRQIYYQSLSRSRNALVDNLLQHARAYDEKQYNEIKESLTEKISYLYAWGLIDFREIKTYKKEDASVLTVYMQELCSTLSIYDELYPQLKVFTQALQKKEFVNKNIRLHYERGIEVRLMNGESLDIKLLSSGEQNQIILLYRLILESKPGSLVLIDEPELSLHLAWIRGMLDEYKSFARTTDSQYLISTHSAAFISGQWDTTYDLFENNEEPEYEQGQFER